MNIHASEMEHFWSARAIRLLVTTACHFGMSIITGRFVCSDVVKYIQLSELSHKSAYLWHKKHLGITLTSFLFKGSYVFTSVDLSVSRITHEVIDKI